MSGDLWAPFAKKVDLTFKGEGTFPDGAFRGVALHVNADENGTSDSFFSAGTSVNPDGVCPTWQVYKSEAAGGCHQYLSADCRPACQRDGNSAYAAIEMAGEPDEPMTAYQIEMGGKICAYLHEHMGMPLILANAPGERGLGTHAMGGESWGGHTNCPGPIRTPQRSLILAAAGGSNPGEFTMDADAKAAFAALDKKIDGYFATAAGQPRPLARWFALSARRARKEIRDAAKPKGK